MKIGILRQVLTYVYPSCAVCYTFKTRCVHSIPKQYLTLFKIHLDVIYIWT